MRVRLKTDQATPYSVLRAGDTIDLPRAQARALIEAGQAEPVGPENASKSPPENAAAPPSEGK